MMNQAAPVPTSAARPPAGTGGNGAQTRSTQQENAYAQEDRWFRRTGEEGLDRNAVALLNQMYPMASQVRERAAYVLQIYRGSTPRNK